MHCTTKLGVHLPDGEIKGLHQKHVNLNPLLHRYSFCRINNRQPLKTLWEKEKLPVMSNFSFTHNVFYSIRLLHPHLSIPIFEILSLFAAKFEKPNLANQVEG